MKTITITGAVALAALLAIASTVDAAAPATGCLKRNGQLIQFKLGNKPLRNCPRNTKKVSLSVHESNQLTRFHEVIGFGEDLTIRGPKKYELFASCRENNTTRYVDLMAALGGSAMIIVNDEETRIGGGFDEDASFSVGYNYPHNYDLAAKSGTIENMDTDGNRVRVEATLVVNHVGCIVSGTAELFTR